MEKSFVDGSVSNISESNSITSPAISAEEEFEHDLDSLSTTELKELLNRIATANVKLARENTLMEEALKEAEQSKGPVVSDEKGGSRNRTSIAQNASADSGNSLPDISQIESSVFPSDRRKSRFRSVLSEAQPVLTVNYKCYIASKKLSVLQSILQTLEKSKDLKIDDLKAKLEEISIETAAIEDERYLFNESVRIKGKHPITKKVMSEKVRMYFENSLKKKMTLTERLRVQTSFNKTLKKKVISNMKEQRELSKNLGEIDFYKIRIEHQKCCKMMKEYDRKFLQLKARSNRSIQVLTDFRKQLKTEKVDLIEIQKQIAWQERLQKMMGNEERSCYRRQIKLEISKQKLMNNPKRKLVPVVMEYVVLKAQIKEKEKAVQSWKSKVAVAEQARFLHLSSQRYP